MWRALGKAPRERRADRGSEEPAASWEPDGASDGREGASWLRLVPIHCGSRAFLLDPLAERISRTFGMRTEFHKPAFDPETAFDASRGQYNSRILMAHLLRDTPPETDRVLGVTGVDLFIPVLTFVFGEAQLDGRAAIVSFHRLDNAIYGLPPDGDLLAERLFKEAVHELGHTYRLLHCSDLRCVMASSTYVDGIDLKSERFCLSCLEALARHKGEGGRTGSHPPPHSDRR